MWSVVAAVLAVHSRVLLMTHNEHFVKNGLLSVAHYVRFCAFFVNLIDQI